MMPSNRKDREADIIGAEQAGFEMVFRLVSAGFDVLVVEKDKLGSEKPSGQCEKGSKRPDLIFPRSSQR